VLCPLRLSGSLAGDIFFSWVTKKIITHGLSGVDLAKALAGVMKREIRVEPMRGSD
jgi:hypothetical protein